MRLNRFNDCKAFQNSNDRDNAYKNIEEYNPNKWHKTLIVFDYMIPDMLCHKHLNRIKAEIFIRGGKINIAHVFITGSYFSVPKNFETKFCVLFHYMNSKKKNENCNK